MIILFLIQLIEYFEYRNLELDETDNNKKILESIPIDIKVKCDTGFEQASYIHKTQPYRVWKLKLDNGLFLNCADNHIVYDKNLNERFVKDLKHGDYIYTSKGISYVTSIKKSWNKVSMFDLSIESDNHRYYTNDILSHNTISTSIVVLYYCIFNNDKNVMIVANKRATTNEIIEKIKNIYYELPFFLKVGVTNWNQASITFKDTNCKIRSVQANPEAAIGFTIDFLYVDEMAYIPDNIADKFYKSVVPTVVSIDNSKIVFTSTPKGYNLFWDILTKAELPKGDKNKNNFASKRVYWYEVNGRFVTYLKLNNNLLEKYQIENIDVYNYIKELGFEEEERDENNFISKVGFKMVKNYENDGIEFHIPNTDQYLPDSVLRVTENKEWENPLSDYFRQASIEKHGRKVRLIDLCEISSWKEDAIKDIGSLESFKQEYDLQPLSGASMLFDSSIMSKIKNQIHDFEYIEISDIEAKLFNKYEELRWIKDRPDLFNMTQIKDYFIIMSIDISEGLGGDYSVINFFRIMAKDIEDFPITIKTMYDCFKLEQIGIFHSNITSVQELAELGYVLAFETFDDNKVGIVLESNNWGNEFVKTMKEMYNGNNEFSTHVFFRYKHRQDAAKTDIGIKLRTQKDMLVKDYQKRVKRGDIMIHNHESLVEMTTFIKKETAAGNFKYEADGGAHDDIIMSLIELASVYENYKFHEMVDDLFEALSPEIQKAIEYKIDNSPVLEATDYSVLGNMRRNNNYVKNAYGF